MALGSGQQSSSSSSIPSSTSGTSSASATSGGGGGGGSSSGGFFSANGTPALILAFLAIGLFVGGMIAMLGLRRRILARRIRQWAGTPPASPPDWDVDARDLIERARNGELRRRNIGKQPKLWDLCLTTKDVTTCSWAEISMPISARVISKASSEAMRNVAPITALAPHRPRLRNFVESRHFHLPFRRQQPPGPSYTTAPPSSARLEVAVAIAMPAPYDCNAGVPDFSLGLVALPWCTELLESDAADFGQIHEDRGVSHI
ncbi:hypothetical protein AcV5_002416 [Taiwanofungus camphoratus]|nr:hypothetical protein AcV5_002416 [Antrodia cinnamomea]